MDYYSSLKKNSMRLIRILPILLMMLQTAACSKASTEVIVNPDDTTWQLEFSPNSLTFTAKGEDKTITVKSNKKWNVTANQDWSSLSKQEGFTGESLLKITVTSNTTGQNRSGTLSFTDGTTVKSLTFTQEFTTPENYVPAGYTLVWQDEFAEAPTSDGKFALPNASKWSYETGDSGWGNNEIQNYVPGYLHTDTCAILQNGILKIIAKKAGNSVLSIRMNSKESWTYGYFEARLKLPQGKGTWPAFWMLPKNFTAWPDDGEIDILEEVGYRPNWVASSIHCKAYYHSIGTQKTAEKYVDTAESDFHIYAVEWTEEYIKGFVDGFCYFTFLNDKTNNKDTWPFNVPFYLKLNLAWGGNWGGAQGVDETKLPATYEIDYVRVYTK